MSITSMTESLVSWIGQSASDRVLRCVGAQEAIAADSIETLWSGYGQILRVQLQGGPVESVIVKHISPPDQTNHPRGWNSDRSHVRKLRSYDVESRWYQNYADDRNGLARMPGCYDVHQDAGRTVLVMEDLDHAGFSVRRSHLDLAGAKSVLAWLACFHARHLGRQPVGLWPVGTYWHLQTRPEEFEAMASGDLKTHAASIDQTLRAARYQTFVHGDAKVANFCFADSSNVDFDNADSSNAVAAVDFQYVGGGCGMKDVAYFLGSCFNDAQCEQYESACLAFYFERFRRSCLDRDPDIPVDAIETEWRSMYPLAWADFNRFMLGWCPGHSKLNRYSQRMTDRALEIIAPPSR